MMSSLLSICCGLFLLFGYQCGARNTEGVKDEVYADYWRKLGQETLQKTLRERHRIFPAKNVILFLGDGMGIPTVTAMRIYKGQQAGKNGEEESLVFDEFPYVSLAKTYALDKQTPDSANTATAYLCGVKANYATLGLDGRVVENDCEASMDNSTHVSSIIQWAQEEGKWTGLVTTARVTHATPAGLYAHSASRDWEAKGPKEECPDIATQLVHHIPGKNIRVILGGGRRAFLSQSLTDSEGLPGAREDSKNLLKEWMEDKKERGLKAEYVFDLDGLKKVNPNEVDYLLGLFNTTHLPYVTDRAALKKETPTLQELTKMAIEILSRNTNGFFLMVEGANIDAAHHENWAKKALEEGVEFDMAVKTGIEMTDLEDTLIVVTADHSHTLTVSGSYPKRGSDITGLGGLSNVDSLTMTILSYANGPGHVPRKRNLTEDEVVKNNFQQDATYPRLSETHGAEDVSVYARGPMAHLFHGVHDQSYIPHAMAYALCVGSNKELCNGAPSQIFLSYYVHIVCLLTCVVRIYGSSKLD